MSAPAATKVPVARTAEEICDWFVTEVEKVAPGMEVDLDSPVVDFGLDSVAIMMMSTQLSDYVGFVVAPSLVYENQTFRRISKALAAETARPLTQAPKVEAIAVAGASTSSGPRFGGSIDQQKVSEFWRRTLGVSHPWPFEDAMYNGARIFVGKMTFEDPAAFYAVAGRGCIFLANHQVTIESALLATIMAGATGLPMGALAKVEGRTSELGMFMEHMFSYPGSKHPGLFAYLDRSKPEELMGHIGRLAEQLRANERHVLVHITGTRATSCREEVTMLNPMFVEMAMGTGAPIIPVRITGGLPVEPLTEKVEVPFNYGAQDFWIGRPILPEDLAPLGFVERSDKVLGAINGLGPSAKVEEPNPANPAIADFIHAWMKKTGASEFMSGVWAMLAHAEHPSPEVARLLEGARTGKLVLSDTEEDRWLEGFADMLYGKTGPAIVRATASK